MATKTDSLLTTPAATSMVLPWWLPFAASTLFVTLGHSLIKAGLNHATILPQGSSVVAVILHELLQPAVFAGLAVYLMGTLCWMAAVAQKEISYLYPLTSVNYILVIVISALHFHEVISLRRGIGAALIVLGVVMINRKVRTVTA